MSPDHLTEHYGKAIQPCPDCGNEFESPLYMGKAVAKFCTDCRSARSRAFELERVETHLRSLANKRREWAESPVGIPIKYRGLTWDDFRYDHGGENNRQKVAAFRHWANSFPTDQRPLGVESLLITRDVNGVGKTMLACLILQDLINRFEELGRERSPFQFWAVKDVKMRVNAARRFGSQETEEQVYADLTTIPLLILDDVGKEKMTGYEAADDYEMYFTLINKRYNNQLPVILTTNLTYEPWVPGGASLIDLIGRAGVSRLMEMTGGIDYIIEGEDRR